MDEIIDLVVTIEQLLGYGTKDWGLLFTRLGSVEAALLKDVLQDNPTSQEVLAKQLGFESNHSPNYRRYRRSLRSTLLQELLKISLDVQATSSFQRAYYTTQKMMSVFNILRGSGRSRLSYSLAKQLLKTSRRYHFTEMRIELSRYLGRYYSNNEGQLDRSTELFNESERCLIILGAEMKIERIYSEFISHFINDKSLKFDLSKEVFEQLKELNQYIQEPIESYKFYLLFYSVGRHAAEGMGDFEKALYFSTKGFEFFDNLHFDNRTAKYMFMFAMSENYLKLGELSQAYHHINLSLDYLHYKGHANWFNAKHLMGLIELHQKNYDSAFKHHLEISQHSNLNSLPEDKLGVIRLQGAYLEFLRLTGEIQFGSAPTRFRINKFINEVPKFNADKRGMRIPLIVAQLLYNLYDRNYDAIEDRIYALKDYCSRNLMRQSENFRSNCFIKMLLLIPSNNFNPIAARRKTNNLLRKLSEVPYELSTQSTQIEIIPYEDLWQIILKYLKSPKRKRVSKYTF